jgi:hypothetical protein
MSKIVDPNGMFGRKQKKTLLATISAFFSKNGYIIQPCFKHDANPNCKLEFPNSNALLGCVFLFHVLLDESIVRRVSSEGKSKQNCLLFIRSRCQSPDA